MPTIRNILDDIIMTEALNLKGEVVNVDSVERGEACNCTCIYCNEPVGARQGDINAHSFYHLGGDKDCPYKTIIWEKKRKELQKFQTTDSEYISLRDLLKKSTTEEKLEIDKQIQSGICPMCGDYVSIYMGKDNKTSWVTCRNFKNLRSNCGCRLPLNTYLELLNN